MAKFDALKKIATVYNGYDQKFGIPRQSGIVDNVSRVVIEPEFARAEAFNGIEEYEYLWLIWEFTESEREKFSPTVRPPRLGGNKRMGVFATRSPFRPNPIGLSSVRLIKKEIDGANITLFIEGADILNGTPVYDIKPYIPYTDSHAEAKAGFSDIVRDYSVNVTFDCKVNDMPDKTRSEVIKILAHDPRPSYIENDQRVYGLSYNGYEVKFVAKNDKIIVKNIIKK